MPRSRGVVGDEAVERDRRRLDLVEALLADELDRSGAVDVLVVARLGLRRGREDRLRQLLRLDQTGREPVTAHLAGRACSPSSPSRTGSRGPRTRSGASRAAGTRSTGRPRAARAGGSARARVSGRTRSRTARSGRVPCPGSRSAGSRRTSRCGRSRRAADARRRARRARGPCRFRRAGLQTWTGSSLGARRLRRSNVVSRLAMVAPRSKTLVERGVVELGGDRSVRADELAGNRAPRPRRASRSAGRACRRRRARARSRRARAAAGGRRRDRARPTGSAPCAPDRRRGRRRST